MTGLNSLRITLITPPVVLKLKDKTDLEILGDFVCLVSKSEELEFLNHYLYMPAHR